MRLTKIMEPEGGPRKYVLKSDHYGDTLSTTDVNRLRPDWRCTATRAFTFDGTEHVESHGALSAGCRIALAGVLDPPELNGAVGILIGKLPDEDACTIALDCDAGSTRKARAAALQRIAPPAN